MTDGTRMARDVECTSAWFISSACATPFRRRIIARRTAVILMGSKVAFKTRTGSCMTAGLGWTGGMFKRRFSSLRGAGSALSLPLLVEPVEPSFAVPPEFICSVPSLEVSSGGDLAARKRTRNGQCGDRGCTCPSQGSRTGVKRRTRRHYIIYQEYATFVNSGARADGVGATN